MKLSFYFISGTIYGKSACLRWFIQLSVLAVGCHSLDFILSYKMSVFFPILKTVPA
jgi:hypothetical protein